MPWNAPFMTNGDKKTEVKTNRDRIITSPHSQAHAFRKPGRHKQNADKTLPGCNRHISPYHESQDYPPFSLADFSRVASPHIDFQGATNHGTFKTSDSNPGVDDVVQIVRLCEMCIILMKECALD
nr:hypothetical protein BgiMline_002784 [Biomphalaria glabrata]